MMNPAIDIPFRIRSLPRDERGYPIPWFVALVDGKHDFRVIGPGKREEAVRRRLCWVCGGALGRGSTYVVGPMCVINRTTMEPAAHYECAAFSARACPFLTLPDAKRREHGLPADAASSAPGTMLKRNPGVIALWSTRKDPEAFGDHRGGFLFHLPDATLVEWFREGRRATHQEILESIESGLPILRRMAISESQAAVEQLEKQTAEAMKLVPTT